MRLSLALSALGIVGAAAEDAPRVKNIAIIGAGAAGSSAAYHLSQFASTSSLPLNITIFEKSPVIGGRTLTIPVHDDPRQQVEVGASIFVSANHILVNATRDFGLSASRLGDVSSTGLDEDDVTAIWDGQTFVFESKRGETWWWEAVKMVWRYGTSPFYAMKLMQKTVATFLQLYEEPMFPFRSLTQSAMDLGLNQATGVTGEQFLAAHKINKAFSRHIIQAATRVNYASNLAFIHGLETMVSFATDGAMAVDGGNWQIFDGMVARSGAFVNLNTTVTSIDLIGDDKKTSSPQYTISTKDIASASTVSDEHPIAFDGVIIASPWQYSDIKAPKSVVREVIDSIPYTRLHVTLFTSPHRLRPGFFGLQPTDRSPTSVYTTLREDETPQVGKDGVGGTGFYSISTLQVVVNPKTGAEEYLYKIFSVEAVTPTFLSDILGADVPESFTSGDAITWHHAHVFNAYPIELPRVTFQDPVVGDNVYYTSGIESFISCMETSALMGKNVARLAVDDLLAKEDEDWVMVEKALAGEALPDEL
ncbi:Prenylcysteine oxidase [Sarocladium strictum]